MTVLEGIIKFRLDYTEEAPLAADTLSELNAWRKIMYLTELIGQDPDRYDGYGYGNISQRVSSSESDEQGTNIVISGTQTGHLPDLTAEHYATIIQCIPEQNLIVGSGPIRPSSESLTHGTVYALDPGCNCVIHAHSPHIWQHAQSLGLPTTRPDVTYGTPAMADETCRLFKESDVRKRKVFAMGGHTDGVITFGRSPEEAGTVMLATLALAFQQMVR